MSDPLNGWQRRILQKLERAPRGLATAAEIAAAMGYLPSRAKHGHISQTLKRMLRGDAGPDIPVFRVPPPVEGEPATWGITAAGRRILTEIEDRERGLLVPQGWEVVEA